jgi:transposase InsO family protein
MLQAPLKRWRRQFKAAGDGVDRRKGSSRQVAHRLSAEECKRILLTCNEPKYASLPPSQIVPNLADQGIYIGSERSFYRVLHANSQLHRRADGPNQVWSWDISYLPTSVKGIWLYLYLVVDIWSRKVVAWDVEQSESAELAAQLVSRACLKERISKRRTQLLILHADNGTSMRGATLEVRLEELGVLRSFSRPRVSNDNPYSESLFRTVKYRPNYPNRPFRSKEEACQWVSSFVDWYNHQHRHSGIKFVTPEQRHCGEAIEICRQRSRVYELARIANPNRWSRSIRCWKQPDLVWINEPLATEQTSLQVALVKEA